MLEQEDFEGIGRTMGVAAEKMQDAINSLRHIAQNYEDEYIPLRDRLAEFIEDPDKAAGFVFVGNDTWLPKHLVNARKRQQRKVSRRAESGIVWTR